ncbi:expansin A13 [Perilla frutescens var. frutescens]|nr:expansin A13 [Perilla frutescens var. frutescens]
MGVRGEAEKEETTPTCRRLPALHHRRSKCGSSSSLSLSLSVLLVNSHYFPSTPSAASHSDWKSTRATYYAATGPIDAVGGACGYGDLVKNGYGKATTALSTVLFEKGQICGACFEIRCVEDLRWCIPGISIIVTAASATLRTPTSSSPSRRSTRSPSGKPPTCRFSTGESVAGRRTASGSQSAAPEYSYQ